MKKQELVSIITPSYNSSEFILETIQSVLDQTYTNWEMIIVDDNSTDESQKIIRSVCEKDERVKSVFLEKNQGAAVARNIALQRVRGKYIAFLDSDDLWRKDKLYTQIEFMELNGAKFSFSAYQEITEEGKFTGKIIDRQSLSVVGYRDMLKKSATIGCLTVMIDRSIVRNLEMPNIRRGQDYAFWLLLLKSGVRAYNLKEELALYRVRKGSISRNKFRKAIGQWRIYREFEALPISLSAWYFINYAFRALNRR